MKKLAEVGLWLLLGLVALLMASTLGGCSWLESVESKLPPIEACFYTKYGKVCAVKVVGPDGKGHWMIRTDLSTEERAEAEAEINREGSP